MTTTPSPSSRPTYPDPFAPAHLGPLTLRNRIVKPATNEAMSRGGLVTEALIAWHREFAAGGVGMTTLAYCAIGSEGRTFKHQIWMREEALPGLRRFVTAMHDEGAAASVQLGHAGYLCPPHVIKRAPMGPSRRFSPNAMAFAQAMTSDEIAHTLDLYGDAARLAVEAGFDAIEVHVGHGYLLSEFLSPADNKRRDEWGGSLTNRARLAREALRRVRTAAGPKVAVYAKLNMEDGFRGGMPLHEGVEVARLVEADGTVDALQLTGGHTTRSPLFLMRGDDPIALMAAETPNLVRRLGMLAFARLQPKFAFDEAFFLRSALQVRAEVHLPLMLLGGVTRLDTIHAAMARGFEFVAMGRALIREPDLVNRYRDGQATESLCIECNRCVVEMEKGRTRCVYRPQDTTPLTPVS